MHDIIKDTFNEKLDVVFEPLAGGSNTIQGVFNTRHVAVDPNTEQVVSSNQPTLGIKLSDLNAVPRKRDRVKVRGKTYLVADCQEDGEGWAVLFLHEVG